MAADTPGSLSGPALRSFRAELDAAIAEEFESQQAFARALGVTGGYVTQLLAGPGAVTAKSLAKILAAFTLQHLQERLHAAWVNEFVPRPDLTESLAPQDSLDVIERTALAGANLSALQLAKRMRDLADDPALRHTLTERIIQIELRLTRIGTALSELIEMQRLAAEDECPTRMAEALWIRGLALRSVPEIEAKMLARVQMTALAAVEQATGDTRRKVQLCLERDYALHVLKLVESRSLPQSALADAINACERSIAQAYDENTLAMGLEVRSRIEAAQGFIVKAEDTLDELREEMGAEVAEKSTMTRAKILAARGEEDQAIDLLQKLSKRCLEMTDLHHLRRAEDELARLLSRRP